MGFQFQGCPGRDELTPPAPESALPASAARFPRPGGNPAPAPASVDPSPCLLCCPALVGLSASGRRPSWPSSQSAAWPMWPGHQHLLVCVCVSTGLVGAVPGSGCGLPGRCGTGVTSVGLHCRWGTITSVWDWGALDTTVCVFRNPFFFLFLSSHTHYFDSGVIVPIQFRSVFLFPYLAFYQTDFCSCSHTALMALPWRQTFRDRHGFMNAH